MKRLIFAAIVAATAGSIAIGAPADPVAWKLQDAPAAPVKPGARFRVKLLAKVQEGWHLYSLKPMAEGPIATHIWIAEGQPFLLSGRVQAPDPEVMQDPTFGMEVELYEGEAEFTLPVQIAANTAAGTHSLIVSASYQSCNDKVCLPPKIVKVELPIHVAKQ